MNNIQTSKDEVLLRHVRALESRTNKKRYQYIVEELKSIGITPSLQKLRWPSINNVVVDFNCDPGIKLDIVCAHYDAAKGSPGANDNASGVSVLLELCKKLRGSSSPVRIIFFDREEPWVRTPFIRFGLLGSWYYALTTNLSNIINVYNLESCGQGNLLAIWPINKNKKYLTSVVTAIEAAEKLGVTSRYANVPIILFNSDHFPFRVKGIKNSISLTILPNESIEKLDNILQNLKVSRLLFGRRPKLPNPLGIIHTKYDKSDNVSENSLQLMLSIVLEIIFSKKRLTN